MGRREKDSKTRARPDLSEDEELESASKHKFTFSDSDDYAEANEDLSLKIVQKAISRASHVPPVAEDEAGGSAVDIVTTELIASTASGKKKIKKEKKKKVKSKKIEAAAEAVGAVNILEEGKKQEVVDAGKVAELSEPGAVENGDNSVLRRLLRGPRYFDPPDNSWGACFNCGETGHSAVNCTSARRKKPCFICGSFDHGAKKCTKGKDCFICNEGGHRAKDCPKKFKRCSDGSELCLRCGAFGHTMPSCNSNYSPTDLKEIRCYVCKNIGHLCCVSCFDTTTSEASCYNCGQSGHSGLDCRTSRGETAGTASPSSCFKCGEGGHFARECMKSSKAKKRCREVSTPKSKFSKGVKVHKAHKSAPQDLGKAHKKKKLHYDEDRITNSGKQKRRGGWTTDDPGDFPWKKSDSWKSPATPIKNHRISSLTNGGYGSNSRASRQSSSRFYPGTSSSPGYSSGVYDRRFSATPGYPPGAYPPGAYDHRSPATPQYGYARGAFDHRFSAQRFGNYSSDGMRRNYGW